MSGPTETWREALAAVRRRREALHEALVALEDAQAAPADSTLRARLRDALAQVRATVEQHIAAVEGPGGLFDQLAAERPHVLPRIDRLRSDHDRLRRAIAELEAGLDDAPADTLREQAVDLVALIARHRHAGADLLFEAYQVDVSAAD